MAVEGVLVDVAADLLGRGALQRLPVDRDFARVLDIDEEELGEHGEEAETIAGFLLDIKGEFLQEKEVVKHGRFTFTVIKVIKHRIAKVKVTVK